MSNPNQSQLDWNQALKRSIDANEDAVRMILAESQGIAIELDESDGDSVAVRGMIQVDSSTLSSSSTAVAIGAELAVDGYSNFQIMSKNVAALTGSATIKIEVSPVTSGDVWIDSGSSLVVTGSTDQISSIASLIARRVRLKISATTVSDGSATIYLLARG